MTPDTKIATKVVSVRGETSRLVIFRDPEGVYYFGWWTTYKNRSIFHTTREYGEFGDHDHLGVCLRAAELFAGYHTKINDKYNPFMEKRFITWHVDPITLGETR